MTPEQERARDMYMAELWGYCREVSYGDRARKREADRVNQRAMEEWDVLAVQATNRGAA